MCNGYVQHACSCSCAGSIHAAHEQLHTFAYMYFAHLVCLYVAYMWRVSIFVYAAHMPYMCSMYAVYMPNMCSKVTGMYTVCIQHVRCMYAACMLYVCLICAAR